MKSKKLQKKTFRLFHTDQKHSSVPDTDRLVYLVTGITVGGLVSAGFAYRDCPD